MPRASIIIPTYNRAAVLGDAIRSALAQTLTDIEVIVVDDGSTDSTPELVGTFGDRITYVSIPHCGRPGTVRNLGLRVSHGEYVAFLDSDDLILPDKLAVQAAVLDAHPNAGLAYSNGYFFRDDPGHRLGYVLDGMPTPCGDGFADLLRGSFLFPAVVLIRRSCFDTAGGFDEGLVCAEDYDLWLRLAAHFSMLYIPGCVAAIRRHKGSLSENAAQVRSDALSVLRKAEHQFPQLSRRARAACHEGYARNHGAIAVARLGEGRLLSAVAHGMSALAHAVRTRWAGVPAFVAWWKRRQVRRAARP
jgi:glycosyltransferase involved in cell wall biosynthesis